MNDFLSEANQKQILLKSRVIQDSNVYLQKFMTLLEQSLYRVSKDKMSPNAPSFWLYSML